MRAAETCAGNDAMGGSYAMSGRNHLARWVVRKSRAQRGMRPFTAVMGHPLRKDRPKMPFVERNHPIETLAPCCPDEAFTMRVRLRRAHRRLQHLERHRPEGLVHSWREDAIAIMDEETIRAIQRQAIPELLDRPFRVGVVGQIPVHDATCADGEQDFQRQRSSSSTRRYWDDSSSITTSLAASSESVRTVRAHRRVQPRALVHASGQGRVSPNGLDKVVFARCRMAFMPARGTATG